MREFSNKKLKIYLKTTHSKTCPALIENYLSDRNQKVVLQNSLSEVGNIKGGVPQGSVLAPLLFIRCQTLSKAFDISQHAVQITSRFSNDKQILW
jgi:hypothetical protein